MLQVRTLRLENPVIRATIFESEAMNR